MKRVGIPTYLEKHGRLMENMIGYDYVRSVINNGAIPLLIPFTREKNLLNKYIDEIDGLLLPGGDDLDPQSYNQKNSGLSLNVSPDRDFIEFYLLEKALENRIPLLGICRGCQLINVFLGGTLYQDIAQEHGSIRDHVNGDKPLDFLSHEVKIEKNSAFFDIYKSERIKVNSRHHQGIRDLSSDLIAVGWSDDGIIEAVENSELGISALQWHPENLIDLGQEYNRLFQVFIQGL
jgi:putative glutamine amidotransferase